MTIRVGAMTRATVTTILATAIAMTSGGSWGTVETWAMPVSIGRPTTRTILETIVGASVIVTMTRVSLAAAQDRTIREALSPTKTQCIARCAGLAYNGI